VLVGAGDGGPTAAALVLSCHCTTGRRAAGRTVKLTCWPALMVCWRLMVTTGPVWTVSVAGLLTALPPALLKTAWNCAWSCAWLAVSV